MHRSFTRFRGLLITLGLAVVQSCSHHPAELPAPTPNIVSGVSISEAQAWYKEAYPGSPEATSPKQTSSATASATTPTSAELLWNRALKVGTGSQQLVLVPLSGDEALFAHNAYAGRRYLIVAKQATNTLDGKVIEVLLHRTTQPVDTLALFTSLYRSNQNNHLTAPTQGEGYVFLYSANYQYLTGRRFEQGQFLPGTTRLAFQLRPGTAAVTSAKSVAVDGETTTNMAPANSSPCLDWYSGETGKYITTTGDCSSGGDGGSAPPPVYTGGGGPCGGTCGGSPGSGGYGGSGGTRDTSADGISSVTIAAPGPAIDPKKETKCFTGSQGATLTIYVQEAKQGTRNKVGPAQVGHTFVGIEQNGITRYMGYYPQNGANSALVGVGVSYPGELHDNSGSLYDVSISAPINGGQLTNIINYINNYPVTYNLNSYNCADFGIAVGNLGGMNLPATTTRVAMFDGRSPGDLGEDIRAMSTAPANGSINKTGGNAPSKQGTCP